MSHAVEAFVMGEPVERGALRSLANARRCPLVSGLWLLPFTAALSDELTARFSSSGAQPYAAFWKSSGSAEIFARALSAEGPVVYFETEYFGGTGGQAAAVWNSGALVLEPTVGAASPISDALRLLGVRKGSCFDEFDAVGIGTHRSTDDWAERGVHTARKA